MSFNKDKWNKLIQEPHWYLEVPNELENIRKLFNENNFEYENLKEEIYSFFQEKLKENKIFLGKEGKNFDLSRKPIDTIVIHHTSMNPGLQKDKLSAIELLRLYAMEYASPKYKEDREIKNRPVYSGHFRDGIQVFWPYHWIIRTNGDCERLLLDNEIGWHAGNWDINCRSVAIVFDNDYEYSSPSDIELKAMINLIKNNYPLIKKERIFGHCEINIKTKCPSKGFLDSDGVIGWKNKIMNML